MSLSLRSLVAAGTKLYLDSVDPALVVKNIGWGAVGATSNPVIIGGLLGSGRFDEDLKELGASMSDSDVAWHLTDKLVRSAQQAFLPIWKETQGNAGWVSFELDPLIEDPELNMPHSDRVSRYIELGKKWSAGHQNRMIKVPATPAGIDALEELTTLGITLNVTLIFTMDQYIAARDSVWRGAKKLPSLENFKSVYSIFVSRVDQYTKQHAAGLSEQAQGLLGIVNAKRIWQRNQEFWKANPTRLQQEIIFASTGTKDPKDAPWKYVEALAGSDIQTNPPDTNDAIAVCDKTFTSHVAELPSKNILDELDQTIDTADLYKVLMTEGIEKFATPQKKLIASIHQRRNQSI